MSTDPAILKRHHEANPMPHHIFVCMQAMFTAMTLREEDRAACYGAMLALGNFSLAVDEDVEE